MHDPVNERDVWQVWELGRDDPPRLLAGVVEELKELLDAHAVDGDEDGLRVVIAAKADEGAEWLAQVARMGMAGVLLDDAAARVLPEPYFAERIGFVPGVRRDGELFCAHRLGRREVLYVPESKPVRSELWSRLLAMVEGGNTDGNRRWIGLCGAGGLGKSYLLQLLARRLGQSGYEVAEVRCLSSDPVGSFAPWKSILHDLAGDGSRELLQRVGRESGLSGELAGSAADFLMDGKPGDDLHQSRDLLPRLLVDALLARAKDGDVAVVLDDWQFLDGPGRRVMEILKDAGLWLLAARRGQAESDEIDVGSMSEAESRVLLSECAGGLQVTEDLNREVNRISGGIPLLAREIFTVVRGAGGLRSVGGTVDLSPGGLQHLRGLGPGLESRLEALSPELRSMLAACAIWRDPFSREQAELLLNACAPEWDFDSCWNSPQLGDFIVPTLGGRSAFSFYHDLLREAAHGFLTPEQCRLGHEAALDWMNRSSQSEVSLKVLSYHAHQAGRSEEAMIHYDRLAEMSLARFALRDAEEAVGLAEQLDRSGEGEEARLRQARRCQVAGGAAFHSGDLGRATELLERSLELFGERIVRGKVRLEFRATCQQFAMLISGKPLKHGVADPSALSAAKAALMLGELAYFQEQRKRSAMWCLLALNLAVQEGESAFLASLCAAVACPLSGRKPRWMADRYLNVGRKIVQRVGDESQIAYVDHVGNLTDLSMRRWKRSLKGGEKGVAYWRKLGQSRRQEEAWVQIFYSAYFLGEMGVVENASRKLYKLAKARTDSQTQLWGGVLSAIHALRCVGPDEALSHGRDVAEVGGDVMSLHANEVVMATAAWRSGKPWQALTHLVEADRHTREEPPVAPMQIQLLEAAITMGEMFWWAPVEFERDLDFQILWNRTVRVAVSFARAFTFGAPLAEAARAMHAEALRGRGGAAGFRKAGKRAASLTMPLEQGRVDCLGGLCLKDESLLARGLRRLDGMGAGAEADHFRNIQRNHEGRT